VVNRSLRSLPSRPLSSAANWTPPVLTHLDACLARLTYFGRAESITEIRRTEAKPTHGALVKLTPRRSGNVVPVLALQPDATLAQLEATTDAPSVKDTNIPPGSRWMYAERPKRPAIRPAPHRRSARPDSSWMQFALGSRIPICSSSTVMVTQRFRGRVLRSFVLAATSGATGDLKDAPVEVRERAMLLSGKDANGVPLSGHAHPVYFLHFDGAQASRLCVWRDRPFTAQEQDAILKAAEQPISLTYESSAWTANLIPLDRLVPLPPSAGSQPAKAWISSTPYVPSRHVFDRHGKEKVGESVIDQITAELASRGYPAASVRLLEQPARWVKVHQPARARDGATNNDKRGYTLALTFAQPQHGPIFLGHSAHFGLGLFVPAD
jgi:CRISPR-associated protein Csb2